MRRSERELRSVAIHIVTLLPEDYADAQRTCELALELKRWEDNGSPMPGSRLVTVKLAGAQVRRRAG